MNRNEILVLVKNAAANVIRGGAGALIAIVLPIFLTRFMVPAAFSAWALVLQIGAYMGYLDFGIQTSVGRFLAHANEKGDAEHCDRIASTSFAALCTAGVLGLCGTAVASVLLPHIFRQMPVALASGAQIALILVGCSLAVGLPASVFNGIFVGFQRNEVPAVIIGGSRILGAILLIFVVAHGGGLARMGATTAAVNVVTYGLQYVMYRKVAPTVRLSMRFVSRETGQELFNYCLSLAVWSFGMLLVSGLDVVLVGYFQFEAVAPYAVATSLITFLAGLQNAIFSAMIPSTAVLHARREPEELGRVMITATRYGTFLLLLAGLPLILFPREILAVWVGPVYAARGEHFLAILAAANMIRLALAPYAVALIGTGQQRLVLLTPLLEGFSNLLVSIGLGYVFGAIGVAIGTLFGSVVVLIGCLYYNMPRTTDIQFKLGAYVRDGFLRPLLCAVPGLLFAFAVRVFPDVSQVRVGLAAALAVASTLVCIWRWGLLVSERHKLKPRLIFVGGAGGS